MKSGILMLIFASCMVVGAGWFGGTSLKEFAVIVLLYFILITQLQRD